MLAPVHAIVDGGLDDALALCVLRGQGVPLAQVVATEGSLSLEETLVVTGRLMASLGQQSPVRRGCARALAGPYPDGRDPFHGADGFGGQLSRLDAMAQLAAARDPFNGPVFCSSALTVVAQGLAQGDDPSEVLWMGGSVAVGGNMTAAAEFNAWMDPAATDAVLASGVPMRMVPLDQTARFTWSEKELGALSRASPMGSLLAAAIEAIHARDGVFTPHDAVTALALTQPDLFAWSSYWVRCEVSGQFTSGTTVVDRRPDALVGQIRVADDVDVASATTRILEAVGSLEADAR